VAEGHSEVPRGCPWPSATLKFYKFYFFLSFTLYLTPARPALPPALPMKRDPNVKTRRIVWNGPGCAKCKPAMSYQKRPRDQNSAVLCETAPRYQNGPVLCKTGFSDKNVAVLCDNGQGPFWYSQAPATPTLPGPCPQSYWVEDHSVRTERNYNIDNKTNDLPSHLHHRVQELKKDLPNGRNLLWWKLKPHQKLMMKKGKTLSPSYYLGYYPHA
jgi:hypothetical protein